MAETLTSYETGQDANLEVGCGGAGCATRLRRASQKFQIPTDASVESAALYLIQNDGANGITVRIETDNAGNPSGTLVDANATFNIAHGDIPVSFGWVQDDFAGAFDLLAGVTYHLVARRTTESGADQNYFWGSDSSSPTYADGNAMQYDSTSDMLGSWSDQTGSDALFKIIGTPVGGGNSFFLVL